MQLDIPLTLFFIIGLVLAVFYGMYQLSRYAFFVNFILLGILVFYLNVEMELVLVTLYVVCPLVLANVAMYVFLHKVDQSDKGDVRYQVNFDTTKDNFRLDNIKRGASIIGSAGSGKTESIVHGFLRHFAKVGFSGIIHDYKDFELTEMAYPLFSAGPVPFKVIAFDKVTNGVNPSAPRYLENEGCVDEVSLVVFEYLLEQCE